jgi:hypothetical protein
MGERAGDARARLEDGDASTRADADPDVEPSSEVEE